MGFLDDDSLKKAFSQVKDGAKKMVGSAKDAYDETKIEYQKNKAIKEEEKAKKKAEEEAYRAKMLELSSERSNEIITAIKEYDNEGTFFDKTNKEELLSFTKEFYDRILMPANSVSKSNISMYPYIDKKIIDGIVTRFEEYDSEETVILYIKNNKKSIVITNSALYFIFPLKEDEKYDVKGRVSLSDVDVLSTKLNETDYQFLCDEYVLMDFPISKVVLEDFATLNDYFERVRNHHFDISSDEVHDLIIKKIGDEIYSHVKKYMIYDDEQFVYWAWGLNSLTAKDYIVCTNKQIIVVDREMVGLTENVKQLYYEDITSANIIQNSNSGDLVVDLVSDAITASTKTCDFELTVAGSKLRINTLYKVEAERITAIYHEMKKEQKKAASQPQVVVQQSSEETPIEKLKKLSELKDAGIISEDEFEQKKVELMKQI